MTRRVLSSFNRDVVFNVLNDLNCLNGLNGVFQTSSCNVCRARRISSRLNSFSFSGVNSALPVGLTMPPEAIARSEPTSLATGIMVQICVTGISSFSISLLIAAPQRVLDPHVEVRITPMTPAAFRRCAMFLPIVVAFSTAAWAPPVEWTNS